MQYWGIQIGAILAGVPIALGIVNWNDRHIYDPTTSPIVVLLWVMLGFCALVYWAGGIGVILEGRRARAASMAAAASAPTNPVGFTTDGRPIYPVVGYTPDGQPVTADRAVGIAPPSSGTNGLAIASLITAFAIPLVGVTLGFVARAQINRTGQDGGGLALAGIIIGILGTVGSIVGVVMVIAALNGTL